MRARIVTFSLTGLILVPAAIAQIGPSAPPVSRIPSLSAPGAASSPKADPKVFPATTELPTPTPFDQIKPASIALPNDPIEPWLLTKDAGPFMVMAKTFRGDQAERYALVLAMELRRDYGLPAYILRKKDFPMGSNIRNVPPTAPNFLKQARLTEPEKVRSYDEATVLVGNEKTLKDQLTLLHKVQKIHPKCLDEMPSIFGWRKGQGLSTALRTTNPYIPTQNLFPGRTKTDELVNKMNGGPRTVNHCPGRYTLQVAEFGGLAAFNPDKNDARYKASSFLRKSPLATAHDDAEQLAEKLAKDPDIQRAGIQPYVYHNRTTSRVFVGAFNNPNDPSALDLRQKLVAAAVPIGIRMKMGVVIAPGTTLTDLEDPEQPIKMR